MTLGLLSALGPIEVIGHFSLFALFHFLVKLEVWRVGDYLSFHLKDAFLEEYRGKTPKFGFPAGAGNTLGEYNWLSKYSRRKEDGTRERFHEGLARVVNGVYSVQKDHCANSRIPWDEETAHRSAQEAYERAFAGKWSPPGRGLWMFGTELVNGRGDSSGLQNCAFISTERIADNPTFPFMRLMSMSMVGVGVGFDTKGAGKVTLRSPSGVYPHVIPDSREGWVDSVGCLLRAYFTGGRLPNFDYSRIRPAGAPIRTFGGVASGPGVLKKFHMKASELLSGREGEVLTSTDIVDIQNLIGKCVVAGNVRRSAEIALGDPGDEEFLNLKDWNVNPERMGSDGWGHSSNNSVIATSGQDYGYLTERIRLNGEPGLVWLDVAQNYGRLSDPPDYKDKKLAGVNPCGEQFLEDQELCTLAESFPTNCADLNDYLRTLKFCFLYSKSVVLLPTSWEETNSVMTRNRRIGLSMTGIAQFAEEHGWHELKRWQDAGYKEIRKWDEVYSSWLGVRESIRVTTVKPSGTVSLLHGVTPGVHWPRERGFYVRTLRELKDSPLAEAMRDAGYPVEPSYSDPETTVVISVPVEGPDIRAEHEVSIWEKVSLAAQCQRWWSDNAVSVTITFREDEGAQIPAVLRAYDGQLKSVSFLPMAEGVYRQAPYQRVSREVWDEMRAGVKPVDWDRLYSSGVLPEAEGESYCSTDVCEIPR